MWSKCLPSLLNRALSAAASDAKANNDCAVWEEQKNKEELLSFCTSDHRGGGADQQRIMSRPSFTTKPTVVNSEEQNGVVWPDVSPWMGGVRYVHANYSFMCSMCRFKKNLAWLKGRHQKKCTLYLFPLLSWAAWLCWSLTFKSGPSAKHISNPLCRRAH